MRDTKTKPITDPKRLRALAQNIELCAQLKGRTLEAVAKGAKVPLSTIAAFLAGRGGVLTSETLERLAAEFGLQSLELIGTHGPLETRRAIFEALFDPRKPKGVLRDDLDRGLLRGSKRKETRVGVPTDDSADEAEEFIEDSVEISPLIETSSREEEPPVAVPAPMPESEVSWSADGYSAHYAGRNFDLKNNGVRRSIAIAIKNAKGNQVATTKVGPRLQPPKSAAWLSNLSQGAGELNRDLLEQVARIRRVDVATFFK